DARPGRYNDTYPVSDGGDQGPGAGSERVLGNPGSCRPALLVTRSDVGVHSTVADVPRAGPRRRWLSLAVWSVVNQSGGALRRFQATYRVSSRSTVSPQYRTVGRAPGAQHHHMRSRAPLRMTAVPRQPQPLT